MYTRCKITSIFKSYEKRHVMLFKMLLHNQSVKTSVYFQFILNISSRWWPSVIHICRQFVKFCKILRVISDIIAAISLCMAAISSLIILDHLQKMAPKHSQEGRWSKHADQCSSTRSHSLEISINIIILLCFRCSPCVVLLCLRCSPCVVLLCFRCRPCFVLF